MPYLTIKELTETVGHVTPRMVRHYHQIGLMPAPQRSEGNYRLYTEADVERLRRIIALKQQGFQLTHIQQVLEANPQVDVSDSVVEPLRQHYQIILQKMIRLRRTASALEGLLGRDRHCQTRQAEALAQLRVLEAESEAEQGAIEALWDSLDAAVATHPEGFQDALQKLLPDLSARSEIEVDLLSQLVLACGDVSLIAFVQLSQYAIKAAREALQAGCPVIADVPAVTAAFDQTRLAHLNCSVHTLLNNPHITTASEAEQSLWQKSQLPWNQYPDQGVVVIGYAPSALMSLCEAIEQQQFQPALVIGMPIGFSHAPAAKRRLMRSGVEFITTEGTIGGGLLAAVALNALVTSLLAKPDCHCYLAAAETSSNSLAN